MSIDLDSLHFIPARQYRVGPRGRAVSHVVVHTAECSESKGSARAVAGYFSTLTRPASAHLVIDSEDVIQCVHFDDVAFAAPPLNEHGVHIELCGRASQTAEQWNDPFSVAQLGLAADVVAALCVRYSLPVTYCDAGALVAGSRGITGHREVSRAWKKSDHTDPGASFPWAPWLVMVAQHVLDLGGSVT